jgi:hypothetical protein
MSGIVIHLPEVKAEKYFEIEVKVNGKQKKYHCLPQKYAGPL